MRSSARLNEKQDAKLENEAQHESKVNKGQLDGKVSNIATLDNGTMIEVFKFLKYCQLANNSRVSKRFSDLIRTHRYSLARLYVATIDIETSKSDNHYVKIFDQPLSPKAYNEWVVCNQYSKQIPFQVAEKQSSENCNVYLLLALGNYKESKRLSDSRQLCACTELNHESWPLFQHFVRLLTDPFIYIHIVTLRQQDVLMLLAEAMYSDQNRLQCDLLQVWEGNNMQKFITWVKDHVVCNTFRSYNVFNGVHSRSNYDEEILDFVMTGANSTREFDVCFYDLSKVLIDFVQKFLDLKTCDDYQIIECIRATVKKEILELLTRDYAVFLLKETKYDWHHTFEFVNNNIGKKLTCAVRLYRP
ncbi:hypothetical protein Ddc_16663 [Ditylenchus destructor]|nr:hypothetical protein Ddc_16663 [Ditylenchus destructor]